MLFHADIHLHARAEHESMSVASGAEFSRELSSEGSQPHIVARLVERAECSELQLAQAQQELKALKAVATARAAAEGAGTSAAMSAAQVSF